MRLGAARAPSQHLRRASGRVAVGVRQTMAVANLATVTMRGGPTMRHGAREHPRATEEHPTDTCSRAAWHTSTSTASASEALQDHRTDTPAGCVHGAPRVVSKLMKIKKYVRK